MPNTKIGFFICQTCTAFRAVSIPCLDAAFAESAVIAGITDVLAAKSAVLVGIIPTIIAEAAFRAPVTVNFGEARSASPAVSPILADAVLMAAAVVADIVALVPAVAKIAMLRVFDPIGKYRRRHYYCCCYHCKNDKQT